MRAFRLGLLTRGSSAAIFWAVFFVDEERIMTANQFLAIVFCIQLWAGEGLAVIIGLVGYLIFGFLAISDGYKYQQRLKHRE